MNRYQKLAAAALYALALLAAAPAAAIEITDEASCRSEIEAIKSLDDDSDASPKFEPVIKDLIEVLEHLCAQKDFAHADGIAEALRTIMAHRRTG